MIQIARRVDQSKFGHFGACDPPVVDLLNVAMVCRSRIESLVRPREHNMKVAYLFLETCPNYEQAFRDQQVHRGPAFISGNLGFRRKLADLRVFQDLRAELRSGVENLFDPVHPGVILLAKQDLTPLFIESPTSFSSIQSSEASL